MTFQLQTAGTSRYIEYSSADFLVSTEREVTDLIGACLEHQVSKLLIHECCLSPDFFDLKTGLAGTLLQKLVNYHVRGAVVMARDVERSERFQELMRESNRSNQFRFFTDRNSAEAWLTRG